MFTRDFCRTPSRCLPALHFFPQPQACARSTESPPRMSAKTTPVNCQPTRFRSWTSCYNRSKFNQTYLRRMHGTTWSHDDERESADAAGPELKAGDKAPDFSAVNDGLQPVDLA